jgi:hypothetical protein
MRSSFVSGTMAICGISQAVALTISDPSSYRAYLTGPMIQMCAEALRDAPLLS